MFWTLPFSPFPSQAQVFPKPCALHTPRLQKTGRRWCVAATSNATSPADESNQHQFQRIPSGLRSVTWDDHTDTELVHSPSGDGNVSYVRWQADKLQSLAGDVDLEAAGYQSNFVSPRSRQSIRNQVQLSTYGNHIGDNMQDLYTFLDTRLKGAIGGVHLLPIYPSSGDGGFAPLTYTEVAPEMGTWQDFEAIAKEFDVCAEFMVNHISPASTEFQDFLEHGWESKYADMFINWEEFWPEGRPTKEDLALIRTRKAGPPVLEVKLNNGKTAKVWCTFGPQQIDINPFSKFGKEFVQESLQALGHRGCKVVRLDAFGYATKKLDTRCFMEEPESTELLDYITDVAQESGIGLLAEVHEEYKTNIQLAKDGFWVYDFALPLLLLHAVTFKTARNLRRWLRICPRRQITVLDTHDGMGIDDIEGLAQVVEIEELRTVITDKLGCAPNFKYHYKPEEDKYVGSPHQYNCTYFSALNGDVRQYLLCRVVQFFTPGIPMVYYVGLLAGRNDWANVDPDEGNTRAINRHRYSLQEADEALQQPVVQALLQLCRARNSHPAFNGEVSVPDGPEHELKVVWENGQHKSELTANFETGDFNVVATQVQSDSRLELFKYSLDALCPEAAGSQTGQGQDQPTKPKVAFRDA